MSIVPSVRFALNFATENRRTMNKTKRKIPSEDQWQKSNEAQQFSEDRAQLLETIREMMDNEFERRGVSPDGNPLRANAPPEGMGREHPQARPAGPDAPKQPGLTFWQRVARWFSIG